MGLSDQRNTREGVYVDKNGIEYMTITSLAKELGITRGTLQYHIKQGNLIAYDFTSKGLGVGKWLDVLKVRQFFAQLKGKKPKTDKEDNPNDFVMPDLPSGELPPLVQKEMPSLIDVDDPINSDCWKRVNGIPIIDDNGHHVISYDKFKQKYDALIRKQQYEREKGKLISKELVDRAFAVVYTPLVNSINQIPSRYATRVIGFVESALDRKLDNNQVTSLRALLEDEAKSIIEVLKRNMEEAMDSLEV